jgi:thiol-disulfide isomerase/thioredoxin
MTSDPLSKRKPRWRRWLLDAAIVLAVFIGLQLWFTRDVVRGPLPVLPGALIAQPALDAQAWRAQHGGDGFVLYVWASWCGVCKAIEGNIGDLAQRAPLLTVAMQSGAEPQVQRHLASRQLAWPTLNDPDASIARQLGVDAVPTLLFIDRHGRVRSVTQGYTTTLGLHARLAWARLF